MTSFAWGADAPIFTEQDLRRLARHLRAALATLVEDPSSTERGRTQPTVDPDSPREERSGDPEGRAHHGPCGPGGHHPRSDFADDAVREAWRERRRAWRMAMAAAEEAPGQEDRWTPTEEPRTKGPKGERGGKGKHRPRRDEAGEGRPERGGPRGPRRPGPEAGEPGSFGWGPGRPFGPFPPFGPFGPGAGGPGRGFRGRGPGWRFEGGRGRAGRGDVRLAILALLSEGPRHGYQLIQDITERSDGAWAPSPGSIYPALSSLQDEGLIDDEKLEGRRVFSLTDAGRAYVADRQEQVDAVFAQNSPTSEHEALAEIGTLMWGVAEAALTVLGTGTESQRAEARDLLARTRRDLFRILAEDTVTPAADARSSAGSGSDDADTEGASAAADATTVPATPAEATEPHAPEPTAAERDSAESFNAAMPAETADSTASEEPTGTVQAASDETEGTTQS